ncbi:hypothetical protein ACPYO6_02120 [Georgenia sp. Z1344]|uniref:hypothetical protein n=1 Tax=Georgenia sp. Z1344 TaxID=3416706 RepID=UPI003CE794C7
MTVEQHPSVPTAPRPSRRRRRAATSAVVPAVALLLGACGGAPGGDDDSGSGVVMGVDASTTIGAEADSIVRFEGQTAAVEVGREWTQPKDTLSRTQRQAAQLRLPDGHTSELGPSFARGPVDEDDVGPYVSIEIAEDSPLMHVPDGLTVEGADTDELLALADGAVAHASQFVVEEAVDSEVRRSDRPRDLRDWISRNRWRFSPGFSDQVADGLEAYGLLPIHHYISPSMEGIDHPHLIPDLDEVVGFPDEPRVTDLRVEVTDVSVYTEPGFEPTFMVEHEITYGTPRCATPTCTALAITSWADTRRTQLLSDGDTWHITGYNTAINWSVQDVAEQPELEPFAWVS